jgi:protein-S-isoprenylcysteine O-methyltransferase Ste14
MTTNSHPLALRIPPLALTFVAGVGAWLCARAIPALSVETSFLLPVAAAFIVLGAGFSLLGVISFRQAHTTVNPTKPGAATALVVSGVYRFTRNPMYLGFLCFLLGELAWLGSPVALIAAPAFVIYLNRFQIAPEECALRARFGEEFSTYARRVPRWL